MERSFRRRARWWVLSMQKIEPSYGRPAQFEMGTDRISEIASKKAPSAS